jgi:hypothetical protein
MGESSAEARKELAQARRALSAELDQLGEATRAATDIPAKIKRNPIQTAGVVGGAAFLLLGGPRRAAKAAEKRFFPERYYRPPKVLPKDVEKAIDRLPRQDQEMVRAHLERDFASYLQKQKMSEPANARQSAWKTYDLLVGIIGAAAARELVKKLFEIPQETKVEAIKEEGEAVAEAQTKVADAIQGR